MNTCEIKLAPLPSGCKWKITTNSYGDDLHIMEKKKFLGITFYRSAASFPIRSGYFSGDYAQATKDAERGVLNKYYTALSKKMCRDSVIKEVNGS